MGRGKNKGKTQRDQKQTQKAHPPSILMAKEDIRQKDEEHATKNTDKTKSKMNPPWKVRWEKIKHNTTSTDWIIAVFTIVLTVVAIEQGFVMFWQLDVMRKDQRAWIAVGTKSPVLAVNTPPSNLITIINTGKTPASPIAGDLHIEVVQNGENPRFEAKIPHGTLLMGSLIPKNPQEIQVHRQQWKTGGEALQFEDNSLTESELFDLNNGKAWVATHGEIMYRDIFDIEHWVKFCIWTALKAGNYSSKGCVAYNSIDNN
jgi:hypothetical protein